jgi:hypothetical protein
MEDSVANKISNKKSNNEFIGSSPGFFSIAVFSRNDNS